MKRSALAATTILAAALMLTGCSLSTGSTGTSSPDSGSREAGPAPLKDAPVGGSAVDTATPDQQVITTGWVSISVADPLSTSADVIAVVQRQGGRIDNRSEQAATDAQNASAQLTVRVPSDRLTAALDELKKLGTVESVSISSSDVTSQVGDLDARITALKTSVDRLLTLMSAASDTNDLIALESALSARQADLDALVSQREFLGDQITFSTIDVQLTTAGDVPAGGPKDFWGGLGVGWATLAAAASGAVVALGVALPWLALLAVIGGIVALIVRSATRKKTPTPL